ncbi:MAG: hypothetical protein M3128_06790 [Verrucomicrobiota bacterium]|nr:hypothetical protein [Verrucomicrobiota bacterium]
MQRTRNKHTANKILWIECIGFSLLIALSWLDELLGLPHLLFGTAVRSNWRESAIESIAITLVWLIVYGATRRVLRRFQYLEDLLTMCAWCRKLQDGDSWVSLEDYCTHELGIDLSHGICPNCGRNLMRQSEPVATR